MADTILIVEDSPTQAAKVQRLLEGAGYEVMLARDGSEALEILRGFAPSLVISDVMMPVMDGFDLCKALKDGEKTRDIPVMLLTSLSDPRDVIHGLQSGADNFVVKPFQDGYLLDRVKYILLNRDIRRTQRSGLGIEIMFAGHRYLINSERYQILDLLLTTYEAAVSKNEELVRTQEELRRLTDTLEQQVAERARAVLEKEKRIKMQERLAAVGQLSAGIAHDFNNMLNVIIGHAEILKMRPELEKDSHLDTIIDQSLSAADLVRQIMDFSRQSILEKKRVELVALVTKLVALFKRTIPESISIEFEHEEKKVWTEADPTQLQQIFINLVVNSRDAMPNGGKISIRLSALKILSDDTPPYPGMPAGSWCRIEVADTGEGIGTDVLPRIFEPFFSTKPKSKGTGLGLAQVYGLVKQHNGFIDVRSKVGAGTTFIIFLPATSGKSTDLAPKVKDDQSASGGNLLLIEDRPEVLEVLRSMLKTLGYNVVAFGLPTEALAEFRRAPSEYSIVLTDITMPEMGGYEIYVQVSRLSPSTRIILMSGYPADEKVKELIQQGRVLCVQKPVSIEKLRFILSGAGNEAKGKGG